MANTHDTIREVRNFVTLNEVAVLSTISQSLPGYPFGSITPYDSDDLGRLVIFIANISEHYRNITSDPRGCMLIADTYGLDDPQAHARISLMGDFEPVARAEFPAVNASYWNRFPDAVDRDIAHTFVFFRFTPKKKRWNGAVGAIRWISPEHYASQPRDPIAYCGLGILKHMNVDHRPALADFVRYFGKTEVSPEFTEMVSIDSDGFAIAYGALRKRERLRIDFPKRANTPADVRVMLIEMLEDCRAVERKN